ncbi:MAG: flagellar hook-associated protein 3 [Gammaproteobacteria bacterium]|nr:flagellar hook-associated protein 3 [Gammaproteobacteria bacterium]
MRISTAALNNQGVSAIQKNQVELSRIQQQLSSGQRILNPSEDPLSSARVLQFEERIQSTEQFQRNIGYVNSRLSYEETILEGMGNNLQRVRELALSANNATLSSSDRATIAQELRSLREDLVSLANSKDSDGNYLFSGYSSQTQPFSVGSNALVSYNGDQGQRFLQVSEERQIVAGDSGDAVLMNIRNGNGQFVTKANTANTGTGVIGIGSVIDYGTYTPDDITITMVTNSSGALAYRVDGASSGQLIPALPNDPVDDAPDFVAGQSIQFNGVDLSITGTPVDGDTFTVATSTNQSVFATVQNLITALESNPVTPTNFSQMYGQVSNSIEDLDQAMDNLLEFRGQVGSRMGAVDMQENINEDALLNYREVMSSLQDVDFAKVVSEMNQRMISLQAAQQSYIRIQGLSLFNYLR